MTSPTLRPCSRGSSRVRFSSPIKPTTRTESAPKSELRVPFPTSPAAPTAGESPGGQRLSIASATISNAFSTSSSRTVGSPPDTISLAPRSSPSSNSQPCEFGFDQLSPRPSAADLKFLHRVPRVRLRNFKSKSGTRIIELLVPFGFRSSCPSVPRCITNFENRALVIAANARRRPSHD